ncbi:MAG: class I SAM-dependent methyltransferase [Alphaproteobacteria bacterium]|nr:class I SAM-dependent methyltransferase [Alphaproteobacteria bacterium]
MPLLLLALACTTEPAHVAPAPEPEVVQKVDDPVELAVSASDRSADDRALDAGRKPGETLRFFGIAPGMQVLEVGAGGGYTAELLARIVGPEGHVYGHNAPFVLERFAEKPWSERLQKPVMANVSRVDAAFDAPLPMEGTLDAVVNVLFYHDTVWQGVDRAAMNTNLFAALKPGGVYGIVDHSARPEDGLTVTETLHRIDEAALVAEIEAAGFVLRESADFLRNPHDTRDWSASPRTAGEQRGTSDRFVLRFEKP